MIVFNILFILKKYILVFYYINIINFQKNIVKNIVKNIILN